MCPTQLRALVEENAMPLARAAHRWFRGWSEAQLGDPRAGYRRHTRGVRTSRPAWHAGLGERNAAAMLPKRSRAPAIGLRPGASSTEAMQCADAIGGREYLTQLLLLDARIADALGEPDRARESMRQAIAEARAQEARWLELLALSALCERDGATAEDFAALAQVVNRLTEGLDTAPVARARALLEARRKG